LGSLQSCRYLLHDRDTKYCESFRDIVKAGGVKPLKLPACSPNLNAFAERWVRSAKEECLSRLILFGESTLRKAVTSFAEHYHRERNHQGKANLLLFPAADQQVGSGDGKVRCKERLGGLLKYYHREAA
jgi:putative transposase